MTQAELNQRYLDLIRRLGGLEPTVFVFGGFAEDALVWGKITRSHSDVDVMVRRGDLQDRLRQFAELGYENFDALYELVPGRPQVLNGAVDGAHLEVSVLEDDRGDRLFLFVDAPDGKRYRFYMEPDTFVWPASSIEGVPVQTVSPLALYHIRESLKITQAFGEFRPHDEARQQALREKFFTGASPELLRPDIGVES
jgi:hypothetical protein